MHAPFFIIDLVIKFLRLRAYKEISCPALSVCVSPQMSCFNTKNFSFLAGWLCSLSRGPSSPFNDFAF